MPHQRSGSLDAPLTTLLLIRHAQADVNGRLCGSYDAPLSRAGRAAVSAVVGRAPSRPAPAALYTSPLMRARQVAVPLAARWALRPETLDELREIDCGDVDGLRIDDVRRRFPRHWARNAAQDDDAFAWPGGENCLAFRARVVGGLQRIADRHPGQRVVVITHAGVISQALGVLRGRRPALWAPDRPDPLTATELGWRDGSPRSLIAFNVPDWY